MVSHKKQVQRLHRVYYGQYGGGVNDDLLFYKAARLRQKGYGLGGFFSSLARRFLPFATKYIVPHAKKALLNVANEVLDGGRPIKESLKENALSALKNVGRDVIAQSGSGRQRRSTRGKRSTKVKKTKQTTAIVKRKKQGQKIKSLFD
jgi:hypothetical protein